MKIKNYKLKIHSNRKSRLIFLLIIIIFLGGFVFSTLMLRKDVKAGWFNDDWHYRKRIVIDDAQVAGSSNLTDFPVLINFTTDNQLRDNAQSDGDDIVFVTEGGVKLDHEIEKFTSSSGELVAWVRIPTLYTTSDTVIYMYYGNSSITNQQNKTGVWDTNYKMVQHVKETSGTHFDSTSAKNDSTTVQVTTQGSATGKINGADEFDNTDDYIAIGDNDNLDITGALTISAWIKADTFGTSLDEDRVVFKGGGSHNVNLYTFEVDDSNVRLTLHGFVPPDTGACTTNQECVRGATTLTANGSTWYYITGTFDGTTGLRVYVNGSQDGTNTLSTGTTGTANANTVNTGGRSDSATDIFDGILDEIRISGTNRSGDWIATEYNNQNSPGTFYSLNSEEKGPSPNVYLKFDEGQGQDLEDQTGYTTGGILGTSQSPGADDPSWKTEEFCVSGKCLFYDGSDDVVTMPNSQPIDFNQELVGEFTIQGWIRVNSDGEGNTGQIFWKGSTNYLRITNEGSDGLADLEANIALGTAGVTDDATVTVSNGIRLNHWHFVAVTYTDDADDEITVYIDSNNRGASTGGNGVPEADANSLLIGGTTTANFHGFIDEFKIYASERTAAEIKTDFQRVSGLHGTSASYGEKNYSFLSDGLVGYWKMDESDWTNDCATDSALDSSGIGNNGDSCPSTTGPDPAVGKFGNAGSFDGIDDYVNFGNPTTLQLTGAMTVSTWVYFDTLNASRRLVTKGGGGTDRGWDLCSEYSTDNQFCFRIAVDATTSASVMSPLGTSVTGQWIHVVGVYEPSNYLRIYKNGVLIAENTTDIPASQRVSTENVKLGSRTSSTGFHDGKLDDTRIYKRALSPAEVQQLYTWAPGPVGYWKLDENSGTSSVSDSSGNGYTLTMNSFESTDWTYGKYGQGLYFDGNNEFLTCTDGVCGGLGNLDFGVSPSFSWGGWFKTNNEASMTYLGKKSTTLNTDAGYQIIQESPTEYPKCRISDGTNQVNVTASASYIDNNWHHIFCTTDGTTMRLFIDGVEIISGSVTSVTGSLNNAADFEIAASGNDAQDFVGILDELKVYNYTRTPTQVVEDMNAGHPAPGSPVGSALVHYKFDEGYGDTVNNEGAGGSTYNGSLSGSSVCPQTFCPDWTNSGKFGKALLIDRSTVTTDGDPFVRMTNDAFDTHTEGTVSMWINVTEDGGNQYHRFFGTGENIGGVANTMNINYDQTNNRLRVAIVNDGSTALLLDTATNSITPGQWYHVAYAVNPSGNTLYVNGVGSAVTYTNGSATTNLWFDDINEDTTAYTIGCQDDLASDNDCSFSTQLFNGYIDDFRLYDTGLTAEQIKSVYNQGQAVVFGAVSTDSTDDPSFSAAKEYCPPGQGSSCTPPVAEWKFDEKTGTSAYDTSGNGNTGTLTNGPTWRPAGDCKFGSCLDFDGNSAADDRVDAGSGTTIDDIFNGGGTVSYWIKPRSEGEVSNGRHLDKSAATNGWMVNNQPCSAAYVDLNMKVSTASTDGQWRADCALTINQWNYVAIVYNDDTSSNDPSFYVNGILYSLNLDTNSSGYVSDAGNNLYFGNTSDSLSTLDGLIDQVRFYDYSRSQSQISWEYNQGGPIGWWKLDECSGTTANDSSGYGNNGTIIPGSSGNTSAGSCNSGIATEMWNNGTSGKRNASLDLDGTDDYITANSVTSLIAGRPFAIAGWAKTSQNGSATPELFAINTSAYGNQLLFYQDSEGQMNVVDNVTTHYGTKVINDNSWHHFVIVLDDANNTITTYIDGTQDISVSSTDSIASTDLFSIGQEWDAGPTASNFWDGQIDEVKVYPYAPTIKQIINDMNGGAVRFGN